MMDKGKVIKVEKHYSTLITPTGEFVNIKNKGTMYIGQNVIFTEYDIHTNKSKGIAFKTVAAVLALVILLNAYTKISEDNLAFAVVSLDINPSIELKINDEFNVLEIKALNEDGKEIIDKAYIGMEVSYVVENLVENAKQKKYLTENGDVLIATAILNGQEISVDDISDSIYNKVFKEDNKINVYMINSTKEDYEEADKKDISLGKYKVIQTTNADINIEQVKNQSVKQLKDNNILNKKEIVNKRVELEKMKKDKKDKKDKEDKEDKEDKKDKKDKSKEHRDKIKDKYKEVGKIEPKEKNKQDNKLSEKLKADIKNNDENQKKRSDIREVSNINNKLEKDDKEQDYEENKKLKDDIKEVVEEKKEITNNKAQKYYKNNKTEKDNKNSNNKKHQ